MAVEPDIRVFRPDRAGIRKVLGDLEAEIMELIWARPGDQGTTVRDVFETLSRRRRIAYTTVMTTMARLVRKKLLRARRQGQAYVYSPNFTEEEFISRFVGRILENLLISFSGVTLERLERLSDPRAAARAREILARITRRRAQETGEA
jgi:predicted transcriptional regulator